MEERVSCKNCKAMILPQTAERYEGICKPCFKKQNSSKNISNLSSTEEDLDWELSPNNAHPKAKEKLKDKFFWEICDDNSPLGNDTGADVLHHYRQWFNNNNSLTDTNDFLKQILSSWEVANKHWNLLNENKLEDELKNNHYNVLVRDDVIIALAFSQIVIRGMINQEIKRKALWAIERQSKDLVIEFRGWDDEQERKVRLLIMQNTLKEF